MKKDIGTDKKRLEITADGKREFDYGAEDLNKDPKEVTKKEHKDKLPGGLADKKKPSDFDPEQLEAGHKVEMEHTSDHATAREIAMDHLTEDPDYYKKLKTIEKATAKDVEDGRTERLKVMPAPELTRKIRGSKEKKEYEKETKDVEDFAERYKKKIKKSLQDRWDLLKAGLDHEDAILDMAIAEGLDENAPQPGPEEAPVEEPGAEQGGHPELEEAPQELTGGESQPEEAPEAAPEGGNDEQALINLLQESGHSDDEIAHIIHGHTTPQPDPRELDAEHGRQLKEQSSGMDMEHKQRMNDLEYESRQQDNGGQLDRDHKQRMNDLEYESRQQDNGGQIERDHKQRMLDLEFASIQKEKELEFEYKQKELDAKVAMMAQNNERKMQMADDKAKTKVAENKKPKEAKK